MPSPFLRFRARLINTTAPRCLSTQTLLTAWQAGLADHEWNSLYLSNHDQPRSISRFGDDCEYHVQSAKLLATILYLHQGTPYIYQSEEIGMINTKFHRIEDFRDVESINYYRESTTAHGCKPEQVLANFEKVSRDNARTPMQWTNGDHAGFLTSEPWMSANPNYLEINFVRLSQLHFSNDGADDK